ncbi:MFS transporter [Streptomyces sp. NPDC052701]|uniref:MFS transporter n=1 Tax=Streptomyces sp. NPDC052701 TaxID=3155533 RepID=UPI003417D7B9
MNKRVVAVTVLIFTMFMDLVDSTIVNTALPSIQKGFDASPAQLEWTIGGYMLAFAALLVTGGRLGDIFGRQRVFILGITGFTLASLLAPAAGSPELLILARVLQGAFAGVMVPQVLSTVQVLFKPHERGPISASSVSSRRWARSPVCCSAAGSSTRTSSAPGGAPSSSSTSRSAWH